jgi:cysteine-rich repeat protein
VFVCLPACMMNSQCPTLGNCDVGSGYCTPPENCSNGIDDDNDSAVDCDDTDCMATCAAQITMACMNPPAAMAANMGDTTGGTLLFSGSCTGVGSHEQLYSFTPGIAGETGQLDLVLSSMTDQGVYVRTSCADSMSEIECIDGVAGGTDEKLRVTVVGGVPLTIFVDGYQPGEEGAFGLSAAFTPAVCNDGKVTLPEQCDDMNNMAGDGCDATCLIEPAAFCMSVPAAILGMNMGDTTNGTNGFEGTCTGANARERVFSVTPAIDGMLHIVLSSADDQGIYVRTDCADAATELGCIDSKGGGQDEMLDVAVTAGVPVTVFVDGFKPAQEGPFTLTLTLM